jgi:hypothetical protein
VSGADPIETRPGFAAMRERLGRAGDAHETTDSPMHRAVGRALYATLLELLGRQGFKTAFAGLRCRTRRAWGSMRRWDSSPSASIMRHVV